MIARRFEATEARRQFLHDVSVIDDDLIEHVPDFAFTLDAIHLLSRRFTLARDSQAGTKRKSEPMRSTLDRTVADRPIEQAGPLVRANAFDREHLIAGAHHEDMQRRMQDDPRFSFGELCAGQ